MRKFPYVKSEILLQLIYKFNPYSFFFNIFIGV